MTKKRIIFNAFVMNTVGHQAAGLWRHPDDHSRDYTQLSHWVRLAQLLERGRFDALFVADVLGPLDVYGGDPSAALRTASQLPVNDPIPLVAALIARTRRLGFGVTVSTSYEQPFALARRFTTLDHLSDGRIGWNVVTSMLESAARNLGLERQIDHDERYDRADEFLRVSYALWEDSWEDDAVVRDARAGIYTRPDKVHRIDHAGRYYTVPGPFISEPSPQRTPLLYQAGSSPRGRSFAAAHAEVVFLAGTTAPILAEQVAAIRSEAAALGRDPDTLRFLAAATVVTAANDELAHRKAAELAELGDDDAALTLFSSWTGIDWSGAPRDEPLQYIDTNAQRSALALLNTDGVDRVWTLREVASRIRQGGLHPIVVGGPESVADQLEHLVDTAGIDGFNLTYQLNPSSYEDIVEFVIPELVKRGRYWKRYGGRTLRERYQGSSRLAPTHAGRHRVSSEDESAPTNE